MAACGLTASSHYLNRCWLVIFGFCGISMRTFMVSMCKMRLYISFLKVLPHLIEANVLRPSSQLLQNITNYVVGNCITLDSIHAICSAKLRTLSRGKGKWGKQKTALKAFIFIHLGFSTLSSTHYNDVIVGAITSQITRLTNVYSAVYSGADQRKHQSSTSLAFVRGIHQ